MFELATQDEIDKLRTNTGSDSRQSDEDLQLDDLEVRNRFEYREAFKKLCKKHMENICFLQLLFESFPKSLLIFNQKLPKVSNMTFKNRNKYIFLKI